MITENGAIDVIKFTIKEARVDTAFIEDGVYKTMVDDDPHNDLIKALDMLKPTYMRTMELLDIDLDRITIVGLEEKIDKERGECFRILGDMVCNGRAYRLSSSPLAPRSDSFFRDSPYQKTRYAMRMFEYELVVNAMKECSLFIGGKRKPSEQLSFDFGGVDGEM